MTDRISNLLSAYRRSWGLTQRELAPLLALPSEAEVSRCECDRRQPNAAIIIAAQLVFGVEARDVFPAYAGEVEEEVVREAYALSRHLAEATDPCAQRKQDLARAIQARAIARRKSAPDV